jgi:hypothetical protein
MRQRLLVKSWPGRVLLAAMVVVTIAAGLCLFDGDEHETADHGASFDLCFGLAITSIAAVVLAFGSLHDLPVEPPYVVHAVSLRRLDPPPKFPSLS